MHRKAVPLGASLVAALVVSLLGAHWYRRGSSPPSARSGLAGPPTTSPLLPDSIRFVPEEVEFGKEPVFSGDRVGFDVAVENTSSSSVLIKEFPRSCGCMTFGREEELVLPATLGPGGKLPLHVEIATAGRTGYQRMQLLARGESTSGDPIAPASLTIRGHIMTSILPLPEELWLDVNQDERGSPILRKVVLADEWPGDGLAVAKIDSTAGARMHFGLAPASGMVMVGGLDVRKRHELTITYTMPPDADVLDETITITPSHGSARPATIRLRGRVLPNYEFKPDRLLFYDLHPATAASRSLVYHYHRPGFQDVRPLEIPEGISVEEVPGFVEGTRRFRVTCRLSGVVGRKDLRIVFQVGHTGDRVQVPVPVAVGSRSAMAQEQ